MALKIILPKKGWALSNVLEEEGVNGEKRDK
jgi:hypothetical protein